VFTIVFFIFTVCNTDIPLTLNWIGEQLSFIGIWQQNSIIACLDATGIVLSTCYAMYLYNILSYVLIFHLLLKILIEENIICY